MTEQQQANTLEIDISEQYLGMRLDAALAKCLPDYSRSFLTDLIKRDLVQAKQTDVSIQPRFKITAPLTLNVTIPQSPVIEYLPEDLPLSIVHQDPEFIVINKPINMVTHPGAGNYQGTLLNALLFHFPELAQLPRAGIVHRLDKDTSGLLVVARTHIAHQHLVNAMQQREVSREYIALVKGETPPSGVIDLPIGRHRQHRQKMAVFSNDSSHAKPAITRYSLLARYNGLSLIKVKLETGRTHQIRVHFSHLGHPLLGDQLYSRGGFSHKFYSKQTSLKLASFSRQALHAGSLAFDHPRTKQHLEFKAEIAQDLKEIIDLLENINASNSTKLAGPHLDQSL